MDVRFGAEGQVQESVYNLILFAFLFFDDMVEKGPEDEK
jgi:hypothetical protein